ncbi:cytochrome P450 [Saccharopolyspora sp. K220]|uniref:cytochrome P450 family protein n=1 Tax=Saccharopolyspora soli TaxID=2926618 RepID=UPI001F570D8F|nr:cytochrome P450 [Saccharopolyspora soli]MCI2422439.1 cytochrome P450 [Saccharopolyspora soli]
MTDLDLWSPEFQADPYPAYAALRANSPVHRLTGPMGFETWLVTRYEDARAALADPRLVRDMAHAPKWLRDQGVVSDEGEGPLGTNVLSTDPPDHTRLRKLVAKAFTRRRVEQLRPRVQKITDALLAEMPAQGQQVDLLTALAFPLPITVICELLGVPTEDRADFRAWTTAFVSAPLTEEGAALREQARVARENYLTELIERTRARIDPSVAPDDQPNLVSALIVAADEHDRLSARELLGTIQLLLVAGHETTVNLIGNGMLALLTHPDQLALLRQRPELLPSAVEELLRFDGPVERATPRFAAEDVEIGGVTIPAGSVVSVVLGSADRDRAHISDGNRLDVTRTDRGHLAFGHGIHYCLGASLARLEGQIAIGAMLERFPDLALACRPEELRWRPGGAANVFRGLETLPLRL